MVPVRKVPLSLSLGSEVFHMHRYHTQAMEFIIRPYLGLQGGSIGKVLALQAGGPEEKPGVGLGRWCSG